MAKNVHKTVGANHYDKEAETYDLFNKEKSVAINNIILGLLKQNSVKIVLDVTCGTGSQVFFLSERMLLVARKMLE